MDRAVLRFGCFDVVPDLSDCGGPVFLTRVLDEFCDLTPGGCDDVFLGGFKHMLRRSGGGPDLGKLQKRGIHERAQWSDMTQWGYAPDREPVI